MKVVIKEDAVLSVIASTAPSASVYCCHVHFYYDTFELVEKFLLNVNFVDFHFSIVRDSPAHENVQKAYSLAARLGVPVRIVLVENVGSDVIPFLRMNAAGEFKAYSFVCKLHGKQTLRKPDLGAWWLDTMFAQTLLDGHDVLRRAVSSGKIPALVGATDLIITDPIFWRDNEEMSKRVADALQVQIGPSDVPFFFAGTTYWASQHMLSQLRLLDDFPLGERDFQYGADSSFGHAFERIVPLAALKKGELVMDSAGKTYEIGGFVAGLVHTRFRSAFL